MMKQLVISWGMALVLVPAGLMGCTSKEVVVERDDRTIEEQFQGMSEDQIRQQLQNQQRLQEMQQEAELFPRRDEQP